MGRLLLVLLVFAALLSGCQDKTQADLQRDLGFRHGTPYYIINGTGTEVLDVSVVQPSGVFAKAGFKARDIFLDLRSRNSIHELYALLEESRGKTITVRVVPGGNGLPLTQRPIRSITLKVPSQRLSERPFSIREVALIRHSPHA
jgi:hypothetical protein